MRSSSSPTARSCSATSRARPAPAAPSGRRTRWVPSSRRAKARAPCSCVATGGEIPVNTSPSPFRRIVGPMDDTAHATARLALGRRLAREHGGTLCATYSTVPGYALVPYGPDAAASAMQVLRESDEDRLRDARLRFERECAHAEPPPEWAVCCDLPVEGEFIRQALYAALLVLGQHDPLD